ncbi:hypothetical protein [Nocardia asiatica]|uniref:hypothetical protein n=1 Tax=Nocardia asiatica TaxID=209252 RepID=UPI002458C8E6|nr:hypothetical protein [Nocardia asiatica]
MTDTTAKFDQAHAWVRDSLDALIDSMVLGQRVCTCGHPIDSERHTLILAEYIAQKYPLQTLPILLTEAVIRLAKAKGAR